MTMRILLTGATGFVGRQVLRSLLERGGEVSVIAREDPPYTFPGADRVTIHHVPDLFALTVDEWMPLLQNVDTLLHAAWFAEPGKYLQSPLNMHCLQGTLTMARAAAEAKLKRLVGIGTCFEYDVTHRVLSTETPLAPLTIYAASKASTFLTLQQWCASSGIAFAWCRLFYLYGEGEDPRRLAAFLHRKLAAGEPAELTSGTQVRDFLDVAEAGARIARVAVSSLQGPVNICSGTPVTVRQLAEQIADSYGRRDLLRFGARPDNLTDPDCVLGVPTPDPPDDQPETLQK